eukprot:2301999-Rhodomonas_salina.1
MSTRAMKDKDKTDSQQDVKQRRTKQAAQDGAETETERNTEQLNRDSQGSENSALVAQTETGQNSGRTQTQTEGDSASQEGTES